jgi:hypothetical protein
MKYICPQCGIQMKPMFCECERVDVLHSGYDETGRMVCFRCGLPLRKEVAKFFIDNKK